MTRISATDASRQFSSLLERVREHRESFEILDESEVVARLGPAEEKAASAGEFFQWFTERRWLQPEDADQYQVELENLRRSSSWSARQWD